MSLESNNNLEKEGTVAMSKKQNKKYARKKAESRRNKNVDKYLIGVKFPEECRKLLSVDNNLSPEEKSIAERVRDHQEITDEEFIVISEVLANWRGTLQEHDPDIILNNAENAVREINCERELLNILDERKDKVIKFKYPLGESLDSRKEEFVILNIIIHPMDDSRAVESIQEHLELFKDIPENQRLVYEKAQRGEPVTPEEASIINTVNKKLEKEGKLEDIAEQINSFLAFSVDLKDSNMTTTEEKIEFWSRLKFMPKFALYLRVRDSLGLSETQKDDLYFLN